jgi:hypothetical protein
VHEKMGWRVLGMILKQQLHRGETMP